MNTVALELTEDISAFDNVRRSILNYGLPDIAHMTIDESRVDSLSAQIRTILMTYEPRLVPQTIRAARDLTARLDELKLRFLVFADLRSEPLNVPVEFVADVDVESGGIHIKPALGKWIGNFLIFTIANCRCCTSRRAILPNNIPELPNGWAD